MVKSYVVVWDTPALRQLKAAFDYIRKESLQNAEKVKADLLLKAASLSRQPLRYHPDKLRIDKDTRFRAFELHNYRVTYHIDEAAAEVTILRVRHTGQEPLEY